MPRLARRLLPLCALALAACGSRSPFPLAPPPPGERDPQLVRATAADLERDLTREFAAGLSARDPELLARAFTSGALARMPAPQDGLLVPDPHFAARRYQGPAPHVCRRNRLVRLLLEHLGPWTALERAEVRCSRLALGREPGADAAPADPEAWLALELCLAGTRTDGRSEDLRLWGVATARRSPEGGWRIDRWDVLGGTRVAGGSASFRDVSLETGFTLADDPALAALRRWSAEREPGQARIGLSAVDDDGDGFWDLVVTRAGEEALVFANDGAGGFVPRPFTSAGPSTWGSLLLELDLDGDGRPERIPSRVAGYQDGSAWLDLFTRGAEGWTRRARALELAQPPGERGLVVSSIAPFDADGDGRLDLFLAAHGPPLVGDGPPARHAGSENHLLLQVAPLEFEDQSRERGIEGRRASFLARAFDFDGDGDEDLLEGNDPEPTVLWRNDGTGRFAADEELGLGGRAVRARGASLADVDGTGRWALCLSDRGDPLDRLAAGDQGSLLAFQERPGGPWLARRLPAAEAFAPLFWDPDGDGDRDLYVTTGRGSSGGTEAPDEDVGRDLFLFRVGDEAQLSDLGALVGLDAVGEGRCALPVDVDGDGDLDLALALRDELRLFENTTPARHFLRVRAVATRTHPAALGAIVEVRAGQTVRRDLVRAVDGFQTQVPSDLHFGLGSATSVDEVAIRWPSGRTERFAGVPLDRRVTFVEGRGEPAVEVVPHWPMASRPRGSRPVLDRFLPRPGGGSGVPAPSRRPAVVRLAPGLEAREELAVLAARRGASAAIVLPPAHAGGAGAEGVEVFLADERLLRELFADGAASWPATVVVDARGDVARVFRRPASMTEIEAILDRLEARSCYPDLALEAGQDALLRGDFAAAERDFLQAVDQDPEHAAAYVGLAGVYLAQERFQMAEDACLHAIDADAGLARAHHELGRARGGLGRHAEAVEAFEAARALGFDPATNLPALAEAAYLARDFGRALDAYREVAARAPEDVTPALDVARLLLQLRRHQEALDAYERALALDPDSAEAQRGCEQARRALEAAKPGR